MLQNLQGNYQFGGKIEKVCIYPLSDYCWDTLQNSKKHSMKTRGNDFHTVNSGFSARYKRSAIPAMQKILNRDRKEQLSAQKKLQK